MGGIGTGKTHVLKTARKPILLDSWDPGGSKVLREEIKRGEVIPSRFEKDNYKVPTTYSHWEREFEQKLRLKMFDHVGTYCIDSLGPWLASMLHMVVYSQAQKPDKARPEFIPAIQDYLIVQMTFNDIVRKFLELPCDVILTGHTILDKDELTGEIYTQLKIQRSLQIDIPACFDEVYVTKVVGIQEPKYEFQTRTVGNVQAKTRLGCLQLYEPQDIKAILKKGGLPYEDKPPIRGE